MLPNLPAGTMIVYTTWLYLGLAGCTLVGFVLGIMVAFAYFNRQCVACTSDDYRGGYLSQDEET